MLKAHARNPLNGLGTALRTLTIFPCTGPMEEDFGSSLMWFPLVGALLGLVLYAIGTILSISSWPSMAALLMMAAEIWLTRGLHLDGLADWADSIGGGNDRLKRLTIMKDTSVGAFGVLALILVLLGKWIAFERLLCSDSTVWVIPIFCLSRAIMAQLLIVLPYARAEGGTGKPFALTRSGTRQLPLYGLTVMVCSLFGPLGLVLCLAGFFQIVLYKLRIKRVFGGITGDLVGTANEMVALTFLTLVALPGKQIMTYTGWAWVIPH